MLKATLLLRSGKPGLPGLLRLLGQTGLMRLMRLMRLLGLLLLCCTLSRPAWADAPAPRDAQAVRAVITAQLQALAAGDAVRAFSYAAPAIRSQFGDAASFIGMVQQGYPVLIRPRSTAFFQAELVDGVMTQVVQMQSGDGRRWLATYQLQRQANQQWRISGCSVVADEGKLST